MKLENNSYQRLLAFRYLCIFTVAFKDNRVEIAMHAAMCHDRVRYSILGGWIINRLFVERDVRQIFPWRATKLTEFFGSEHFETLSLTLAVRLCLRVEAIEQSVYKSLTREIQPPIQQEHHSESGPPGRFC
jgi:hypothetical protein